MRPRNSVGIRLAALLGAGVVSVAGATEIRRGPYLQSLTDDSVVIRWRTDSSTDSRVIYGTAPGQLSTSIVIPTSTRDHEVTLDGLQAGTTYHYAVGTSNEILAGDDALHQFRTAPPPGSREPFRVWVLGDSGTGNDNARAVRDAYDAHSAGKRTDLWLMLGDNAYPHGSDDDYQDAMFDIYPDHLRDTVLWPTYGNHDASSADSANQSGPYFDIFTLPSGAQAGGTVSGTEAYYSFDYANVHFVSLNSSEGSITPGAAMLEWLELDLAATYLDWIVAFWHHPPYSKGSHDSDGESRPIAMRSLVVPILEDWGVDLVLTGHSHSYERSFLLDGHYGTSATLSAEMLLDDGDGRIDGAGSYQKATAGPAGHEGAVYVVAGSSGQISNGGDLDHPAMFASLRELGSLVLDFDGDRLRMQFLDANATVLDRLHLVKNTALPPTADYAADPVSGAAPLSVSFTDLSSTNTAAWSWDFDGDWLPDNGERHPVHVYDEPGLYTTSLIASNAVGADVEWRPQSICVSGGVPGAELRFLADRETLAWTALDGGRTFDVLRGNLIRLRNSGGAFDASRITCLGQGLEQTDLQDADVPLAGRAYYYLLRGTGCAGDLGSYDSVGPSQAAPRDPGILASPFGCP